MAFVEATEMFLINQFFEINFLEIAMKTSEKSLIYIQGFDHNIPFYQYGWNICLHLSRKGLLDVQESYFLVRQRIFLVFSYVSVKRVVVLVFFTS